MNRITLSRLPAMLCLAVAALACGPARPQADEPIAPLPLNQSFDPGKVALGARLFDDRRFAKDGSLSCAGCHNLGKGGIDARPENRVFSTGVGGVRHIFNTPTVYNAGLNFRQQWTGGTDSLEALIDKIVNSPRIFKSGWPEVLGKLSADKPLAAEFQRLYPGRGLAQDTVEDALAVFVRSLVTPSRFDRYLRGDGQAISSDEKRGYERFKAYGCVGCHQGVNVGGNMLQRFGAMNDYFADRLKAGFPPAEGDKGRFTVTGKNEDLHVFKVPSLRNVALTAPYFHNGSAATLEEAVDAMFRYQLGRTAPPQDKALIIAFLQSLTGEQFKDQ